MSSIEEQLCATVRASVREAISELRQPERLVYTKSQAAHMLAVDPQTITKMIDAGTLKRMPNMRRVLIPRASIDDYLAQVLA